MRSWHRGWCLSVILPAVVVALASAVGAADEKASSGSVDRKAQDEGIYKSLRDIINHGADLYNAGDRAACYRLYEGALLALKPLLDHRPDAQKAIDAVVADADRMPSVADRAFALRGVMDKIRNDIHPRKVEAVTGGSKSPPSAANKNALWERLGGEANVRKVVADFVDLAAADPKVNFDRDGKYKLDAKKVAELRKLFVELISSISGGPLKYPGRTMKEVHKGMAITDEEFNASLVDLKKALESNGARSADAKELLDLVDSTRKDIVEGKQAAPKPPENAKSLWDRLGGEANVKKVVDDFVTLAAVDPTVNFDRSGKYKLDEKKVGELKKFLVEMISSVSGGPLKYEGRSMKEVHKGMGITDKEFDAAAADLRKALELNGAKDADAKELLDIVGTTRKDMVEEKKDEKKDEGKNPTDK
ncbi:MAG: group 1 truncated hemoglobin [Gemmataceae bacterium]